MSYRQRADEVVVVTGATSGIGRAVVDAYAAGGAAVVGIGRRRDRLDDLRTRHGERFHALVVDVRDADEVRDAIDSIPERFSPITILVNSAGLAKGLEKAPYASLDDWKLMVDTNISGMLHCVDAILPGMVARKSGYVVNMGSIAADTPYAGGNVYGATKSFIRQFTLNLRSDLLGTGVRATCIEPGMVKTEFLEVRFDGDVERAMSMYTEVDHLTATDIAELVIFTTSTPPRVSISLLQVLPTEQAHAGYMFAAPIKLEPKQRDDAPIGADG